MFLVPWCLFVEIETSIWQESYALVLSTYKSTRDVILLLRVTNVPHEQEPVTPHFGYQDMALLHQVPSIMIQRYTVLCCLLRVCFNSTPCY